METNTAEQKSQIIPKFYASQTLVMEADKQ